MNVGMYSKVYSTFIYWIDGLPGCVYFFIRKGQSMFTCFIFCLRMVDAAQKIHVEVLLLNNYSIPADADDEIQRQ